MSDGLFYDYDLVIGDRIVKRTVSSLSPLYTGLISNQDAEAIVKWISNADFCAEYDTIASADEKESFFKPVTYWRGPIWINTNWALRLGLLRYGYIDRAERIRQGVYRLVEDQGFREYYDPTTGTGLGGKNFSWTALSNRYDNDEKQSFLKTIAFLGSGMKEGWNKRMHDVFLFEELPLTRVKCFTAPII